MPDNDLRPDDIQTNSLFDLVSNLSKVADIDPGCLPALLAQLSAVQSSVAARLVLLRAGDTSKEPKDELLTIHEAAERLGVSADWLYRRTRSLPFVVRLGRHVRFSAEGIENFVKRRVGRG